MSAIFWRTGSARRLAAAFIAVVLALAPLAAAESPDVQATQTEAWVGEDDVYELNADTANAGTASAKYTLKVWTSTSYTVNINDTLDVSFVSGGFKSFSSSKPKVADVVDKNAETGRAMVVARRAGTAKLKAKLNSGKKVAITLTVKDPYAPERVSFSHESETLGVGGTLLLSPIVYPAAAQTGFKFSSSKKKVAAVSAGGLVTAIKPGKAKITVKTDNGLKASVDIVVSEDEEPQSVSLSDRAVGVGESVALVPVLTPAGARTGYSWSTSNKKVAGVSDAGVVTGVKAGKATITVKTDNGLKASCTVSVQTEPASGVKYRALLVANDEFYWGDEIGWERNTYNQAAASRLSSALKGVSGAEGGKFGVTVKKNLSKSQLESAIKSAFADADGDDVSLFYFASHGDSYSTDAMAGALVMASTDKACPEYAMLTELRDWLLDVPGKVIVILDTCGSGAAVYKKNASNDADADRRACEAFDAAVARAFSEADPGVDEPAVDVANVGELRRSNKFYVLCSSRYREDSWAYTDGGKGGSYFTDWLVEGIGKTGDMPADEDFSGNKNGAVDLYELFKFISGVGDKFAIESAGTDFYQHVQVYPADTRYEMFK